MIPIHGVFYITIDDKKSNKMETVTLPPVFNKNWTKIKGVIGERVDMMKLYNDKEITLHGMNLFTNSGCPYGTVGCYLSHCKLWMKLYKEYKDNPDYENVLILEDDIDIVPHFWKVWNEITSSKALPEALKWDMIYYDHNTILGKPINQYYYVPYNNAPKGCNAFLSCYMIRISSIPKLLDVCMPIGRFERDDNIAIDAILRNNFDKINVLFYKYHLAKQDKSLRSCRIEMDRKYEKSTISKKQEDDSPASIRPLM